MSVTQAANILRNEKTVTELEKGGVWMAYNILCDEQSLRANIASHLAPRAWTKAVNKR
jgi:hypothetical protein